MQLKPSPTPACKAPLKGRPINFGGRVSRLWPNFPTPTPYGTILKPSAARPWPAWPTIWKPLSRTPPPPGHRFTGPVPRPKPTKSCSTSPAGTGSNWPSKASPWLRRRSTSTRPWKRGGSSRWKLTWGNGSSSWPGRPPRTSSPRPFTRPGTRWPNFSASRPGANSPATTSRV